MPTVGRASHSPNPAGTGSRPPTSNESKRKTEKNEKKKPRFAPTGSMSAYPRRAPAVARGFPRKTSLARCSEPSKQSNAKKPSPHAKKQNVANGKAHEKPKPSNTTKKSKRQLKPDANKKKRGLVKLKRDSWPPPRANR